MRNITTSTTAIITISRNSPPTIPPITAIDNGSLSLAETMERRCSAKL